MLVKLQETDMHYKHEGKNASIHGKRLTSKLFSCMAKYKK